MTAATPPERAARVKCPDCGYSVRTRKDGSPQTHRMYIGSTWIGYCPRARVFSWAGIPAEINQKDTR